MRITAVVKLSFLFQLLQPVVPNDEQNSIFPQPDFLFYERVSAWRKPFFDELAATDTPAGKAKDVLVSNGIITDTTQIDLDINGQLYASKAVIGGYAVVMSRNEEPYNCRDQEFGDTGQYTTLICDFKEKLEDIFVQEGGGSPEKFMNGRIYASNAGILEDVDIMSEAFCWLSSPSEDCRGLPEDNVFAGSVGQLQFLTSLYVPRGFDNELLAEGSSAAAAGRSNFNEMEGYGFEPDFYQILFDNHWFTSFEEGFDAQPISVPIKEHISYMLAITLNGDNSSDWVTLMTKVYILYKYSSELFDNDEERQEMFDFNSIRLGDIPTCISILAVSFVNEGKARMDIYELMEPFSEEADDTAIFNALCGNFDAESYEKAKNDFVRGGAQNDSSGEDGDGGNSSDGGDGGNSSDGGDGGNSSDGGDGGNSSDGGDSSDEGNGGDSSDEGDGRVSSESEKKSKKGKKGRKGKKSLVRDGSGNFLD